MAARPNAIEIHVEGREMDVRGFGAQNTEWVVATNVVG